MRPAADGVPRTALQLRTGGCLLVRLPLPAGQGSELMRVGPAGLTGIAVIAAAAVRGESPCCCPSAAIGIWRFEAS